MAYELSRSRHEMPARPTAGVVGPAGWRPAFDPLVRMRSPRLIDIVPWVLGTIAVLVVLAGLRGWVPDRCTHIALARGAGGWRAGEMSVLPTGVRCHLDFDDGGSRTVSDTSWSPTVGAVIAVTVVGVGLVRPPTRSWRRAAWAILPFLVGGGLVAAVIL